MADERSDPAVGRVDLGPPPPGTGADHFLDNLVEFVPDPDPERTPKLMRPGLQEYTVMRLETHPEGTAQRIADLEADLAAANARADAAEAEMNARKHDRSQWVKAAGRTLDRANLFDAEADKQQARAEAAERQIEIEHAIAQQAEHDRDAAEEYVKELTALWQTVVDSHGDCMRWNEEATVEAAALRAALQAVRVWSDFPGFYGSDIVWTCGECQQDGPTNEEIEHEAGCVVAVVRRALATPGPGAEFLARHREIVSDARILLDRGEWPQEAVSATEDHLRALLDEEME